MVLHTERLILRPWEDSDAEALFEYAQDPRVGPAAGWPAHRNIAFSLECIRTILTPLDNFAICLREDNRPIGAIGLKTGADTELTDRADEAEIGYWLGVPFWGKGYMPEAVREIQRYAFCDLGMSRLWCGYYAGNEKSRRVQEKCGFHPSHIRENVEVSLLNEIRTEYVTTLSKSEWVWRCNSESSNMNKVIVIGCPGSGKSTFARALHGKTGLPIVYLDRLFWNSDQTHVSQEEFQSRIRAAIRGEKWIIDGNYGKTLALRLAACDTVFFLDYDLEICLAGVAARRGAVRPDLPWVEKEPDPEFEEYIRDFAARQVPEIRELLSRFPEKKRVVFRSRTEAEQYLMKL